MITNPGLSVIILRLVSGTLEATAIVRKIASPQITGQSIQVKSGALLHMPGLSKKRQKCGLRAALLKLISSVKGLKTP